MTPKEIINNGRWAMVIYSIIFVGTLIISNNPYFNVLVLLIGSLGFILMSIGIMRNLTKHKIPHSDFFKL